MKSQSKALHTTAMQRSHQMFVLFILKHLALLVTNGYKGEHVGSMASQMVM